MVNDVNKKLATPSKKNLIHLAACKNRLKLFGSLYAFCMYKSDRNTVKK